MNAASGAARMPIPQTAADRLSSAGWTRLRAELDAQGTTVLPGLFERETCRAIIGSYDDASKFRSRVVMACHGFGRGEYCYFAYPLPFDLAALRATLYARLVPLANQWNERLGVGARFPATHR